MVATDPWVVAVVVALVVIGAAVALLFSVGEMRSAVESTAKLIGWVLAITAFAATVTSTLRRRVLFSRGSERAVLRSADPMRAFQDRYAFLLRARSAPVAFLVENLDRCRAEYVVEFLEGIQTLLKHRPASPPRLRDRLARVRLRGLRRLSPGARRLIRRLRDSLRRRRVEDRPRRRTWVGGEPRLVAFLVAADEAWLCTSFLEVYKDLAASTCVPGRATGLGSLDKVFDHALHLPMLPAVAPLGSDLASHCTRAEHDVRNATSELEIRRIVARAESDAAKQSAGPGPVALQRLRIEAFKRLGEIEDLFGQRRFCSDTAAQLAELTRHLDAAADVSLQLRTAYCSQRTAQLLAGHRIETDDYAICRLGLWALLTLKWPLLAQHLAAHPADVACLRGDDAPPDRVAVLADVFADRVVGQVVVGFPRQAELDEAVIERFTIPMSRAAPKLPDAVGPLRVADWHGAAAIVGAKEPAVS
jgi:hypothetical protein